ncbi:MAG: GerMN domain-containing protein [Lachnospiraceae bacterium]|nr:GerMN domain-containing protein [Lachnospiraceae bacterium]
MRKVLSLVMLFSLILLTACGKQAKKDETTQELNPNQIYIYYVNLEKTDMVQSVYTLSFSETLSERVSNLIDHLKNTEVTSDCQSPIPADFTYMDRPLEVVNGTLEVSFNVIYDNVNAEGLLFFKSCVAKTLLQLDGVSNVTINLTDIANPDEATATVSETFNEDSFTMSYGEGGNIQRGNIVLYFASESGDTLKAYRKSVEITNTTSLDRLVVESLIAGPLREGYKATLSEDTVINNIAVKDGICYVDLSEEFYNMDNPLKNDIIVYSVVNSLIELPNVNKVQFLKEGEKLPFYRETMPFDGLFERNLDIVEQEG